VLISFKKTLTDRNLLNSCEKYYYRKFILNKARHKRFLHVLNTSMLTPNRITFFVYLSGLTGSDTTMLTQPMMRLWSGTSWLMRGLLLP